MTRDSLLNLDYRLLRFEELCQVGDYLEWTQDRFTRISPGSVLIGLPRQGLGVVYYRPFQGRVPAEIYRSTIPHDQSRDCGPGGPLNQAS